MVDLGLERVELPNGHTVELEIIRHRGAAAIVAVDAGSQVVLIRQYRWAAGGSLWEIPAGVLDRPDEPPVDCAHRELAEEVGLRAERMAALGRVLPSPGYSTEVVHLFLAEGLQDGTTRQGPDEVITEVVRRPMGQALEMIARGDIVDAKTVAGLHLAAARLGAPT